MINWFSNSFIMKLYFSVYHHHLKKGRSEYLADWSASTGMFATLMLIAFAVYNLVDFKNWSKEVIERSDIEQNNVVTIMFSLFFLFFVLFEVFLNINQNKKKLYDEFAVKESIWSRNIFVPIFTYAISGLLFLASLAPYIFFQTGK